MEHSARPEVLALLAEAKARPDDDIPRLILADFLEDSFDPVDQTRGSFLRLQCQLARMPQHDPAAAPLRQRLIQVRAEAEALWLGPLRTADLAQEWEWHRGLLWISVRKCRVFQTEAQRLLATEALAWVEGVHLRGPTEMILPCLKSPLLDHVSCLSLAYSPLYYAGLRALSHCPALARFSWLNLGSCHITAGTRISPEGKANEVATAPLLGSPHLGRLTRLGLSDNELSREDLAALASTRKLAELEHLDLSHNAVGAQQLIYLLQNPGLSRLTSLRLACERGGGPHGLRGHWQDVADSPALARLTRLDLSENTLAGSDIRSLAESPHLDNLTYLDLSHTTLDHVGALACSPSLHHLAELRLDWERVRPEDHRALRDRFGHAVPPGK